LAQGGLPAWGARARLYSLGDGVARVAGAGVVASTFGVGGQAKVYVDVRTLCPGEEGVRDPSRFSGLLTGDPVVGALRFVEFEAPGK